MNIRYKHWLFYAALFLAATNSLAQSNEGQSIKKVLVGGKWRISQVLQGGARVYIPDFDRMYMVFTKDCLETLAENLMDVIKFPYWIKGKMFYGRLEGRIISETKILSITPKELRLQKKYNDKLTYIFKRP